MFFLSPLLTFASSVGGREGHVPLGGHKARSAYHSDGVRVWSGRDGDLVEVGGVSGEGWRAGDCSGHVSERRPRRTQQQLEEKQNSKMCTIILVNRVCGSP